MPSAPVGDAGREHDTRERSPRRRRRSQTTCRSPSVRSSVDLARQHELRPEDPRLLVGALRELGAADAAREAEVVADQRARARLAADRLALDDERAQPLRGGVDGGGEAGRARRRPRPRRSRARRRARCCTPNASASSTLVGSTMQRRRRAGSTTGTRLALGPALVEQRPALRRVGRVEGVRHAVAASGRSRSSCARGDHCSPTIVDLALAAGDSARAHSWRNSAIVRWKSSSGSATASARSSRSGRAPSRSRIASACRVGPVAPADQQRALGRRDAARAHGRGDRRRWSPAATARRARPRPARVPPAAAQRRQRSRGGALGHHPVVLAVAARQLDLRASERIEIAIDGKQNRLSHAVMVTAVCKPD